MIDLSQHHESHGRVWLAAFEEHSGSGGGGAGTLWEVAGLLGAGVAISGAAIGTLIGIGWGVRWAWRRWWAMVAAEQKAANVRKSRNKV
jgi:hypothetical protein